MKGSELERREEETDREGIERHERGGTERSQGREEEPGALSAQGQKLFLADHTHTHSESCQRRHSWSCTSCVKMALTLMWCDTKISFFFFFFFLLPRHESPKQLNFTSDGH